MKKQFFTLGSLVVATMLSSTAFAYTVKGSVADEDGKAVKDAKVDLLQEKKSAVTDEKGEFTIHEDEIDTTKDAISSRMKNSVGYIGINSGILSYSQSSASPVQVKIFDAMGNQVFKKSLQGAGEMDLRKSIKGQGTYFAQVSVGSAKQNFKFTTDGSYSASIGSTNNASLNKEAAKDEALRVIADGFDTLNVPLTSLDTTLKLTLKKAAPKEEQFTFGYALKNEPRPSKGCGKSSSLQSIQKVQNGEKFQINVNGTNRQFFITLPQNYDNKKPYKLLVANHCMGSSAEDFVHHNPDYDHPTPYYGQQNLDKEGNYIFVAPQGDGNGTWTKGQADHDFFGKMLSTMEENYCIDTTRIFATGFSFGAMFTNSLAQDYQHKLRAVAVYATADYNIWLPNNAGKPIAWMGVHGQNDQMCDYNRAKTSALPRILKNNGKASDGDSKFTDASSEKPKENSGNTGHTCYDFTSVDPRFPVKWCSWPGGHQWTAHDNGSMNVGAGWEQTWVPEEVHKWFEQF